MNFQIGVVGLGVMGANLARNFASKGITTLAYNRTAEKTNTFLEKYGSNSLSGKTSLSDFVASLEVPRKIFIMVKAGSAIDEFVEEILPFLEKGDILIDGGNSHFHDTIRREKALSEQGIFFVGCGVSGGEEGALHGPSLMPGGNREAVEKILPLLEEIAAKDFSGNPCVQNLGENGAGHYTKMVHNGIEYAVMQIFSEGYDLLRKIFSLSAQEIAAVFAEWKGTQLTSYLLDISVEVLQKKDSLADGFLIDHILDRAEQKGTGKWTLQDAADRGIAIPSISEAVNARVFSSDIALRKRLSKSIQPEIKAKKDENWELFLPILRDGIFTAILSSYIQGISLLSAASKEMEWNLPLDEICRIWQGGCIIRADVLETFQKALQKNPTDHLLLAPEIAEEVKNSLPALRALVGSSTIYGYFTPGLSSSLLYLNGISEKQSGANFLQGLRDYFGAHGFERTDREGIFHGDWNSFPS